MTTDGNVSILERLQRLIQGYLNEDEKEQTGRDRMVAILGPALIAVLERNTSGARGYLWQAADQVSRWEREQAVEAARRKLILSVVEDMRMRRNLKGLAVVPSLNGQGSDWFLQQSRLVQGWHLFVKGGELEERDCLHLERLLLEGPLGDRELVAEDRSDQG